MGKHRKLNLKRPSDKLPPAQLQEAWDKYLDNEVGRQGARPRWEVLFDTSKMDVVLFKHLIELEKTTRTSRSEVYQKALMNVIDKLPMSQQAAVKKYFGVDRLKPLTNEEIAKELGISVRGATKRVEQGMKNLRTLIRKELANVVREEMREWNQE